MESKNIKVVDEHGIDRNANVICAIDVDGSDYIVYSIERDEENDNVFVSKLLKNIDGTSSLINIEDSMEKSKIAEIVKELIKYSVENEATTMTGNVVSLPSGKNITISSVLVNKEQHINVQKTYISTVKKTVTKVCGDYYNVKASVESPVDDIFTTSVPVTPEVVQPEISVVSTPVVETPVVAVPAAEVPVVEPVLPTATVEPAPVVAPVVQEVAPAVVEPVIQPVNVSIPNVVASEPVAQTSVLPVKPVTETVVATEVVQPEIAVAPTSVVETPVVTAPTVETPVVEPVPEPVVSQPSQLIFDASKESNLNVALGEASSETKIPALDVTSIREFGEDTPSVQQPLPEQPVVAATEPVMPNSEGKSRGFANNKFFMFIAIAFFVASCVFLGYEVFNYFQLVK